MFPWEGRARDMLLLVDAKQVPRTPSLSSFLSLLLYSWSTDLICISFFLILFAPHINICHSFSFLILFCSIVILLLIHYKVGKATKDDCEVQWNKYSDCLKVIFLHFLLFSLSRNLHPFLFSSSSFSSLPISSFSAEAQGARDGSTPRPKSQDRISLWARRRKEQTFAEAIIREPTIEGEEFEREDNRGSDMKQKPDWFHLPFWFGFHEIGNLWNCWRLYYDSHDGWSQWLCLCGSEACISHLINLSKPKMRRGALVRVGGFASRGRTRRTYADRQSLGSNSSSSRKESTRRSSTVIYLIRNICCWNTIYGKRLSISNDLSRRNRRS